jgi:micrococcal nuclease
VKRIPVWLLVFAALAVGTLAMVAAVALAAGDAAKRPPAEPQLTKLTLPAGVNLADLRRVEVVKVIDGDTIDVKIDGKTQRVRYYGVDTPERGDRCFREATDRNQHLIGDTVLMLNDARNEDRYERLLRYIFLPDGTSVDATLVAEGFGHAWRQDGRYKGDIIALEDQARTADRGCLWK